MKGFGMSHARPELTPLRTGRAICKLNQVQCVLDIGIYFIYGYHFTAIVLTGHSAIKNRQWFCPKVFRKLKIFKEAKAKCLIIIRSKPVFEFGIPSVDN